MILTPNTRAVCCDPQLINYSAGGVVLALREKGVDVRYVDLGSNIEGNSPVPPQQNSAEICCYAVFFGNKVSAFRHMEDVRLAPKAPRLIIAFGPFASQFSEEILTKGLADIVVTSDPEFVIPAIPQESEATASLGTIPNLSYLHEGKIIHTQKHSFHDLDEIPFISPFLYSQGQRPAIIMTARGCRYHCVFCDRNVLWGGGVRNRSIANVLGEIEQLLEHQYVQNIHFLDEDLAADHKRLAAICEGMHRIKKEFDWDCSVCVGSVNQEILSLMGRSRCREIYFGVESASPRVLRRIGKTYGRREILKAVRWSQEAGLKAEVMVTIGNPGETDLDRELTLSVLNELGPDVKIIANRLVILPGTAFYRKGLHDGRFTRKSFFEDEGIIFYDEKRQM